MKKEMLINVLQPEECRIAILEDGVLEELYVERTSHESFVSNIYKGKIVNIEPSIQAAFVDFGIGRNGFLHVSDVEPTYYKHLEQGRGGRDRGERGDRDRGDRPDRGRRGGRGGRARDEDLDRPRPSVVIDEELPAATAPAFGDFDDLGPLPAAHAGVPSAEPTPFEGFGAESQPDREDRPESEVETPAAEEAKAEGAELGEENATVVAHPDTLPEEEPSRGRRRSRSDARRKRTAAGEGAEATGEGAGDVPAGEAGEAGTEPEGSAEPPEPPKPRLMDSAERRTDKDHVSEGGPLSSGGGGSEDDDLLFFPPSAREVQDVREAEPEPVEEFEEEPEPEAIEEEQEPESEPEPPARPPSRPRPPFMSRGNIEDDLEADLAAAEIEDDFSEEIEENFEAQFEEEPLDADDAPFPPRTERRGRDREGGRGRDREGGRGRDREGGRGRDRDRRGGGRRPGGMSGRPGAGRPKPLIQDIFRRGQEVLVQVIKDGLGSKGPTLSTYISIAGRYLVLMPVLNRVGVSRKIQDEETRHKLRQMFNELKPPPRLGFIIRTAVVDKNRKELQRDLSYLSRLYKVVVSRIRKLKAPALIYQESDMVTRTIRDTFTSDIDTIWIDEPKAYEQAKEFMDVVMPRYANRIKLYDAKEPMFHKHGIEDEIVKIQQRKIPLPNGGSIVIEQTEALVAIDVNSGNFRADNNAEETAYQMNLHAAKEIARQLRLRDLAGVIVNDFIDMRDEKHRRGVERAMRDAVTRDRARTKILKISAFGLIEMTRQRVRPSLKRSVYQDCPFCHGMALVKTCESMSIDVMRKLQLAAFRENVNRIEVHVAGEVANYLLNKKRGDIAKLEAEGDIKVDVFGKPGSPPELLEFLCFDNDDNEVHFQSKPEEIGRRGR